MEKGLFNITSATTTELIAQGVVASAGSINQITIANCSSSNAVTIRLFYSDGTNDTSIVENLSKPAGCTLLLDHDLKFNSYALSLKLQTTGTSPDVNVIIK